MLWRLTCSPHPANKKAYKNKNEASIAGLVFGCVKIDVKEEMLTTKIIQHNVFVFYTQALQHLDHRSVHHWWATHVVFTVFWRRMILQIVLIQHIMNESCGASPIVFRLRVRHGHMPLEVFVLGRQLIVLILIEEFAQ